MEDETIVEMYVHKDESAIRRTSEKYGRRLRALSLNIVGDWQTAEECENDTYMAAWNSIPPHEPKSYLYAFLARITRHLSLNCCRERSRLKRSALISEKRYSISESKVKTMLFRMRNQMRSYFEQEGYEL